MTNGKEVVKVNKKKPQKRRKLILKDKYKDQIMSVIYALPWIIGFAVFFMYPLFTTIRFSFSSISTRDEGGLSITPLGIGNYRMLFTDFKYGTTAEGLPNTFTRLFFRSIGQSLLELPLITIFSLLIAVVLNQKFPGRGIARTVFFLPIIFGLPIISKIGFATSQDGTDEVLSNILEGSSLYKFFDISFLFRDSGVPGSVIRRSFSIVARIFEVISFSGVQILVFLSALQSIDPTLYEVAQTEGATRYEMFWKVTLPTIFPILTTVVVYTFIDILYRSPMTTVITNIYQGQVTVGNAYGMASAIAVVFLLASMIILVVILLLLKLMSGRNEKRIKQK